MDGSPSCNCYIHNLRTMRENDVLIAHMYTPCVRSRRSLALGQVYSTMRM